MKLLFYVILNVLFLLGAVASAAPVGNIGAPLLWGEGFLVRGGLFNVTVSIDFDRQKNVLPDQLYRPRWLNEANDEVDYRHFDQIRSSKNEYTTKGVSIGAAIKQHNLVYLMAGVVNSTIDLKYYDKTISYSFTTYSHFESDNDLYYGIGWSAIMHEGTIFKDTPVRFCMDTKYRKLEMEDNDLADKGKFYSTSLDEFQWGIVLSAQYENLFPYFGFRLSSLTGKEHFIDMTNTDSDGEEYDAEFYENGYIEYSRDISWFKNTGYLAGVSYYFKELVIINAEYRSGSEEGVGFSATVKF